MSRTDKDRPYRIADRYRADHYCLMHKYVECDLPPYPTKHIHDAHHVGYPRRIIRPEGVSAANWGTRCTWDPIKPHSFRTWYDKNPNWWMTMVWTGPTRQMVRDKSIKALQDYNANGSEDFEYDIPNFRRKHEGGWYW